MNIKLEISKSDIKKNLEKIRKINKNIIYVLKDDAYGLGVENIFPVLVEMGCDYFAVSYMEEALELKKILSEKYDEKKDKIRIMTLNFIKRKHLKKALENDIEITVFSFSQLNSYISEFKSTGRKKKINIHIKINTGMNRLGFNEDEVKELCSVLENIKKENVKLDIKSVYTHISDSENIEKTEFQIEKYEKMVNEIEKNIKKENGKIRRHVQASPLLFRYGEKYNYDFARIGMAIYGMEPLSFRTGLKNAIKLSSEIINIRKVAKGEKISYGERGILKRDSVIAVISGGYAHGLQKQIESHKAAHILVKGEKAPILGEICMDMVMADITDIPNVKIEDEIVFIGKQGNNEITLLHMSEWAGTIQDDILAKCGKNIKKKIVK